MKNKPSHDQKSVSRINHAPTNSLQIHPTNPSILMTDLKDIQALAATSEIRALPSLERIDVLHRDHGLEVASLCSYFQIGRRRYYRWLKRGKKDGKPGRKPILSHDQEKQLVEKIVSESKVQNAMTTEDIAKEASWCVVFVVCGV